MHFLKSMKGEKKRVLYEKKKECTSTYILSPPALQPTLSPPALQLFSVIHFPGVSPRNKQKQKKKNNPETPTYILSPPPLQPTLSPLALQPLHSNYSQ